VLQANNSFYTENRNGHKYEKWRFILLLIVERVHIVTTVLYWVTKYKEVLNFLDRLAACALIGDWFVSI
jgi:hypothetical protein